MNEKCDETTRKVAFLKKDELGKTMSETKLN